MSAPFDATKIGANVRAPTSAENISVVDLEGLMSPAKSDSVNNDDDDNDNNCADK